MKKPMAIIAGYLEGEAYGLLGPQMAATIIEALTPYECIVIAVTHSDDKADLKKSLYDYFKTARPVVGFSNLNGRQDLFFLAKELKEAGAFTILAGPQADVDFRGETGALDMPHRFQGVWECFSAALHGPAEQVVSLLNRLAVGDFHDTPGLLIAAHDGAILETPRLVWQDVYLGRVRWDNLYRLDAGKFCELRVTTGQVLQHIGCPHAVRPKGVEVDYPAHLDPGGDKRIQLTVKGCSFCDVAVDKGFHGTLAFETVLSQIRGLPETEDGRKIAFELINENPLPGLPRLIRESRDQGLNLTGIHLTMRADWFLKGEAYLREALHLARKMRVRILLASMGFESFNERILKNLNKGVTVAENLGAVRLMRRLKQEFPFQWAYSTREGASHGFIHPTPWDTRETVAAMEETIADYNLASDVLPPNSIPLIIHHASGLADWMRAVEKRENMTFKRYVTVIGWWEEGRGL